MENKIKITYAAQYDKIVGAYLRNELEPLKGCACFVGNLLNKNDEWEYGRDIVHPYKICLITPCSNAKNSIKAITEESQGMYSIENICSLEQNFLRLWAQTHDENSLFLAMESTLLMLKEIHEKLGEVIEPYTFTKRLEVNI